jgi:hypothetical protein
MYHYARDHNGKYPSGASSTEIFQKLIDGLYLTDPGVLFVPSAALPGKVKTVSTTIKPENVCWDVTVPVDSLTSNVLPLVYETGFRVAYVPGGKAVPILPSSAFRQRVIAVCYCGLNVSLLQTSPGTDGYILNFVPVGFDPDGKTYRQLTPDGPLPEYRDLVNRPSQN